MQSWACDSAARRPVPIRSASSGSGKRKWGEGESGTELGDVSECDRSQLAELCRQSVMPRTQSQLDGSCDMATFYPLPHDLNQAVLRSLGIGSSKDTGVASASGESSARSSPGLLQPTMGTSVDMDMDAAHPLKTHGPQCTSIPQLSVRYYGGTRSQLWAYCPDCQAFSQVHEDQPVILAYSP
ncbi:Hypothetical protein MSYG_2768 [Malassezia sympodialis ATCC 42132]|uniref:Uncharacterized protein n=1 Tax=Malassezia sympodialis (strain ATCC 42132) TaxID=1230383 RepID=A0A1M8A8A9_MALS4|nr:Hypothetical protein MSYG_2768 [Malassezia sympodialis ATCC 42132]